MEKGTLQYDVIVIGGGASGMMVAGRAAAKGKRVLLLEKNGVLGQKLRITGGGRCNITNAEFDTRTLLKQYGEAEQFLYSSFSQFGVQDTFDFFTERGLPLVVQARKRAFPSTEKAEDVAVVMEQYVRATKQVTIRTKQTVTRIESNATHITGVVVGATRYTAHSYVIATGGQSHPETGSTGDGFLWLRTMGHTVVAPTPTLVPLAVADEWVHNLSGVSLSFMKITFFQEGKKIHSKTGKILFTHFGLSGPLILNSAASLSPYLKQGIVQAYIDMYPDTDEGALDTRILGLLELHKNKSFKNAIEYCVPEGMAPAIRSVLALDPELKVHSVSKAQRQAFIRLLKAMPCTITGLMGFERAIVADGGVPLTEVDMKTMRSLKKENLFITGDLLHINRPSGGFSLQLCWTTGYVAGEYC